MFSPLYNGQQPQSTWKGCITNGTDVEKPIVVFGGRINAKTSPIRRSVRHCYHDIAVGYRFNRFSLSIQSKLKPGTAMITKKQLFDRCAIVEPRTTHEWYFFHIIGGYRNIGIESYAKRISKISPVDYAGIRFYKLTCKGAFNRCSGIMWQFERVPGVVITGASSNYPKGNSPPGAKYTIDNLVNRAITTHDDHRASFFGRIHREFLRLSLPVCLNILCLRFSI